MSERYLILHKVRGQPAFDVATQLRCPVCDSTDVERRIENASSCHACKGTSFWWIIPTSGHRAYPLWHQELKALDIVYEGGTINLISDALFQFDPEMVPDHYSCNDTSKPKPPTRVTSSTDDFLV